MRKLSQKIGTRIRQLRRNLDLTQEQMARKLSVSDGAISSYELGDTLPNIKNIIGIAQLAGVSIDWLLTGAALDKSEEQQMTEEEAKLLTAFRSATKSRQEIALEILEQSPRSRVKR